MPKPTRRWPLRLTLGAVAVASLGATLALALSRRTTVVRCPAGLVPIGARCCSRGQQLNSETGACTGTALSCAISQTLEQGACRVPQQKVAFAGGQLTLAPNDWEAQGKVLARTVRVGAFWIDRAEVSFREWNSCVAAGSCGPRASMELDLPVTSVTPTEAEAFCRARGGRLPDSDEWLFAAAGQEGRRFPWGQTGLVCRRAAFGLRSGPCAVGATGPERVGSRPDGATPEGLLDMAGNVAEFTWGAAGFEASGGSFRSQLAVDLKVWKTANLEAAERSSGSDLGFRCAYDQP